MNSEIEKEREEWLKAYAKVKSITNTNLSLTFDLDDSPITCYSNRINVSSELLKHKTSFGFKFFSLLHEEKHSEDSPSIYFECMTLDGYYERKINESVCRTLYQNFGEREADKTIIDFVKDRIELGKRFKFPRNFDSREEYLKRVFPKEISQKLINSSSNAQ
jgi:hypothetical protein